MRRGLVAAPAAAATLVLSGATATGAGAAAVPVSVQFAAFGPGTLNVLPGETVTWENVSERRHTVVADDGSFASGDLFGGDVFSHTFDAVGGHPYHCTVHPGMVGEVDVSRVTLGPLPVAPVPAGDSVQFTGRTADPGLPVRIERGDGVQFTPVAAATPAPDGAWSATVAVSRTGDYRAESDQGASGTRRLLVSDRRVVVRATRAGVAVRVTPALPYSRVVLQQVRRERFGWWPAQVTALDYVSRAAFRVRRPARVRVALVDRDGWTPLVTSRVLVLGPGPQAPGAMRPSAHHG
ncbi:MAG: hypothetical protein JWO02_1276 [Solirubrobacterales bacterium]|nr:hypothetical protein [Solirubrobacterales bacterium]